jgi:hypothetical protein
MFTLPLPLRRLRMQLTSFVWRTPLARVADSYRSDRELRGWVRGTQAGAAPALVKRALLRSLAAAYRLSTFVETGTSLANTTYALRNDFDRIITIELDPKVCANARRRLSAFKHISVRQGDSASLLPQIVKELTGPALFFLDGHYSGLLTARGEKDTPVLEELGSVMSDSRFEHVIVIDDARCFTGENDYPTLEALQSFVSARAPQLRFFRHTDMITLTPGRSEVAIGFAG